LLRSERPVVAERGEDGLLLENGQRVKAEVVELEGRRVERPESDAHRLGVVGGALEAIPTAAAHVQTLIDHGDDRDPPFHGSVVLRKDTVEHRLGRLPLGGSEEADRWDGFEPRDDHLARGCVPEVLLVGRREFGVIARFRARR
jgi:hypothetical protein